MNIKKIMHVAAWMIALLFATPPLNAGFFDSLQNAFSFINTPAKKIATFLTCWLTLSQLVLWKNKRTMMKEQQAHKDFINNLHITHANDIEAEESEIKEVKETITWIYVQRLKKGYNITDHVCVKQGKIVSEMFEPVTTYIGKTPKKNNKGLADRGHYGIVIQYREQDYILQYTSRSLRSPLYAKDSYEIIMKLTPITPEQANANTIDITWEKPGKDPVHVTLTKRSYA